MPTPRSLARLLAAFALVLVTGCAGDEATPAPTVAAPPFRHQSFYDTLTAEAEGFNQSGGDWIEDYGDAPFYGLAFYAHTGAGTGAERVPSARARALDLLDGADFFADDLQEITMSAFGIIERTDASGDGSDLPVLDLFIDRMDALVGAVGFYLGPAVVDSWALDTYGSTAVSALIGLINAEYAYRLGGERAGERVAWAAEMAEAIAGAAHDGQSFAFGPDRPGLFLYPNVAMILLDGRLFQLTGEARYRDRALGTFRALDPLILSQDPLRYASPYSAEAMGAITGDYSTLSSQNYLLLALAVLFEITRDTSYVDAFDSVLDFLGGPLHGQWCLSHKHQDPCTPACDAGDVCLAQSCTADRCQGGVLHHFMDGRVALPTDPEYFCSGCNLQTLYALWYRKTRL